MTNETYFSVRTCFWLTRLNYRLTFSKQHKNHIWECMHIASSNLWRHLCLAASIWIYGILLRFIFILNSFYRWIDCWRWRGCDHRSMGPAEDRYTLVDCTARARRRHCKIGMHIISPYWTPIYFLLIFFAFMVKMRKKGAHILIAGGQIV